MSLAKYGAALLLMLGSGAIGIGCASILDLPDDRRYVAAGDGGNLSNEAGLGNPCPDGKVKVRILIDLTGATAFEGVPFYYGEYDYLRELNGKGGIAGRCPIEIEAQDYAYSVPKAREIYEGWKKAPDWDKVVTVFGWGTGDSVELAPAVKADRKPFLSASYIGFLGAPEETNHEISIPELGPQFNDAFFPTKFSSEGFPFNFYAGTDYSTGARIAMFHIKLLGGKRVGHFYCTQLYCKGPIPAAREYAKRQGLELGRDLTLELTYDQVRYDADVRSYFQQEKDHKLANPTYQIVDWIWMGNTSKTTAYLANSIANIVNKPEAQGGLGLDVQIMVNNWGFDEDLYARCPGACADIVHGIMPFVAYGDGRAASMAKLTQLHDKWRALDAQDGGGEKSYRNVRYVQGYVNAMMFEIAAERVVAAGKTITGESIKEALETFQNVDTGGLTDKLNFSPTDHRPQSNESIYKFDATGKMVNEPPDRRIVLESSWLGW